MSDREGKYLCWAGYALCAAAGTFAHDGNWMIAICLFIAGMLLTRARSATSA